MLEGCWPTQLMHTDVIVFAMWNLLGQQECPLCADQLVDCVMSPLSTHISPVPAHHDVVVEVGEADSPLSSAVRPFVS